MSSTLTFGTSTKAEETDQRNVVFLAPSREIQEIRDTLKAFKAAVQAGEVTGFPDGEMRAYEGS
jgi:hypothetical protein